MIEDERLIDYILPNWKRMTRDAAGEPITLARRVLYGIALVPVIALGAWGALFLLLIAGRMVVDFVIADWWIPVIFLPWVVFALIVSLIHRIWKGTW